jgi:cytochrome b subunit of formate dehydrogenase
VDEEQKPRERSFIRELVPDWHPTREQWLWAIRITVVVVLSLTVIALLGVVLWGVLDGYMDPRTATEKKDLVQSFAVVSAGVVAAVSALAAVGNLYISRRNLQQQQ